MLKVIYHKDFTKDYKKLPKKNQEQFANKFLLFLENPNDKTLKDHPLKHNLKGKRSFWITGDVRVVYKYIDKNIVLLLRIGTHNQVY